MKLLRQTFLLLLLATAIESPARTRADALADGRAWLRIQQRADGAIADRNNPLFETWETILAGHALHGSGDPRDRAALRAALRFLATQADPAGTVCHNRRCRGATCVETTAEYWRLRRVVDGTATPASVSVAVLALQEPDGRFRIGNPDVVARTDFPSVTAFAMTLVATDPSSMAAADRWLRQSQQADGQFGAAWEYYGTPAYAAWAAAQAWSGARSDVDEESRQALRDRLVATQEIDGSWPAPAEAGATVSAELVTALSMLALQALDPDAEGLARARSWLLEHQAGDGHWPGGRFPIPNARYRKSEDVAATAWALQALEAAR